MKSSELELISKSEKSKVISYSVGQRFLAIKMVSSLNKKECQLLRNQFKILQILHHPHIIQAYKLKEITAPKGNQQLNQLRHPQIALVLEFANKGSLLNCIHKQNLSLKQIKQFIIQIASGLAYLHSNKIAHRDIKLQNVLVFEEASKLKVKICDFGLASLCEVNGEKVIFDQFRGTQRYIAPEIYEARSEKYNKYEATKTDSFSLGVVSFALLFKRFPFEQAVQTNSLYILIIQRNYEKFWNSHGIPQLFLNQPKTTVQAFKKMFERLVCYIPAERLSMQQLLQTQFLIKQL